LTYLPYFVSTFTLNSSCFLSTLLSIYSIFPETRLILKQYGFLGKQFANLAFEMLNDVIRPFTTKWHRMMVLDIALKEKNEFEGHIYHILCQLLL
jgi:hypothetical protein